MVRAENQRHATDGPPGIVPVAVCGGLPVMVDRISHKIRIRNLSAFVKLDQIADFYGVKFFYDNRVTVTVFNNV